MTVDEAYQRGNNLVGVALAALAALSFLPDFVIEGEASHRLDEFLVLALGIAAVVWFLAGRNALSRSLVPLLILVGDLVAKVIGLVLEQGDKDDLFDDGFTALILLAGGAILMAWLYFARRRAAVALPPQPGLRTED